MLAAIACCPCCYGEGPELRLVHRDGRLETSRPVPAMPMDQLMARWLLLPDLPRHIEQMGFLELRTSATKVLSHFCQEEGKPLSYAHSQEPRFWMVPVAVMDLPLSLAAVQGSHGQVEDITLAEVVPWHRMKSLGHPPGDRVQLRAKSLHKKLSYLHN